MKDKKIKKLANLCRCKQCGANVPDVESLCDVAYEAGKTEVLEGLENYFRNNKEWDKFIVTCSCAMRKELGEFREYIKQFL